MNIRGIANSAIQGVNKNITALWKSSQGYTTDAAGHRVATTTDRRVSIQVQALDSGDLQQMDGLNIQGVMRSVHMYGNVAGVIRADKKGGDILLFPEFPGGPVRTWNVVKVMETWPTWARVVVLLQA